MADVATISVNSQKQRWLVLDDVTLTAGAANTTSDEVRLEMTNSDILFGVEITNGATGPTAQATVQMQVSFDGTHWYPHGTAVEGGTTNDLVTVATRTAPAGVMRARFVAGGNTDQDVTVRVEGGGVNRNGR